MHKPHILLDVDGVLLNYNKAFEEYHGLNQKTLSNEPLFSKRFNIPEPKIREMVIEFGMSEYFSQLEAFPNAIDVLSELSKDGYEISIISSCGLDERIHELRKLNLNNVFGDIFSDIHLINFHESKLEHLKRYSGNKAVWIDDNYKHYIDGKTLGFNSIWRTTDDNRIMQSHDDYVGENIIECWKEIRATI